MARLAQQLGLRLDLPVLDETGLAGLFDLTVTYSITPPADVEKGSTQYEDFVADAQYRAFLAQTGLKLSLRNSVKKAVRVLLIQRISMPTAN